MKKMSKQSNTPLVIENEHGEILGEYSPALLESIKNTVAKGATDEELYMFLQIASMYNLNPFLKQIWFIKMKGEPAIMTGRDGYLHIAKQNPHFVNCQSNAVYENDEFKMSFKDGMIHSIDFSMSHKERGRLVGAYAYLKTNNGSDLAVYCDFKEYNKGTQIWKKYPTAMIRKVAENDVLKRFADISGIMTVEDAPREYQEASDEYIDVTVKEV